MILERRENITYRIPENEKDNKQGVNNYRLKSDEAQVIYGDTITTANMDSSWDDTDNLVLDFYKGGELVHSMTVPVRSSQQYTFPGADYVVETVSYPKMRAMGYGGAVKSIHKLLSSPVFSPARTTMAKPPKTGFQGTLTFLKKRLYYRNQLETALQQLEELQAARAPKQFIDQHVDYIESLKAQLQKYQQGGKVEPWHKVNADFLKADDIDTDNLLFKYQEWKDENPGWNALADVGLTIGSFIPGANAAAIPLLAAKTAADLGSDAYTKGEVDLLNVAGFATAGLGGLARFGKLANAGAITSKATNAVKASKFGQAVGNSKLGQQAASALSKGKSAYASAAKNTYNKGPEVQAAMEEVAKAQKALVRAQKSKIHKEIQEAKKNLNKSMSQLKKAKYRGHRLRNTGSSVLRGIEGTVTRPISVATRANFSKKDMSPEKVNQLRQSLRRLRKKQSVAVMASTEPIYYFASE